MRTFMTTWLLFVLCHVHAENASIVVAKDGSGNFLTITEALNSIPANNTAWKVILIKDGVYDEHVMIRNNYIALVGESRSNTRIEHNLSRTSWKNSGGAGSNTGCGVINIWTNYHHIVIGNLTVKNTYSASEDYTEVIRSETGTTKIWVVNCTVWSAFKDSFAPWGKAMGMYYVADCSFQGSIDMFCPRGWCYALHCTFIETRYSSPIWHEGVSGLNQKLVIRNAYVTSKLSKYIKLQNSQSYAKFYYLDCIFNDSIEKQGVTATTYFLSCSRQPGGTVSGSWFADNYYNNSSNPQQHEAVASWAMDYQWYPEDEMPAALPYASLPQPYHKAYGQLAGERKLYWIPARNAVSYNVYFGNTTNPPLAVSGITGRPYTVYTAINTTYYWRVDAVTQTGAVVTGKEWQFTTTNQTSTGIAMSVNR